MDSINGVNTEIKSVAFEYGVDDERFKMEYKEAGATKYTRYYSGEYEKEVKADGTVRHLNYIYASGGLRNIETIIGRSYAGQGTPYRIYLNGTQRLNE
jgi:hypothetical protein